MDEIIRREKLKNLFRELHKGRDIAELKEKFALLLQEVSAEDIARVEEELIKEGISREKIQEVCSIHLALLKEKLAEKKEELPVEHPIGILLIEHKRMLEMAERLKDLVSGLEREEREKVWEEISHIAHHFQDSEKHYLREENVLFPYLERHGITEPPKIMWMEHDRIREAKKGFYKALAEKDKKRLKLVASEIFELLNSHFYKENNILFPTALKVIGEKEFREIKKGFAEIGYCCFTPVREEKEGVDEEREEVLPGVIKFETGEFNLEELSAVLNTLPFDITFVNQDDEVKYFNSTKERIFLRTKSVLGRKVQQCHPPKSIHIVEKILTAFKKGERDVAEFWIPLGDKLVHIRYFAVRDKDGKYLGTLEVTQNITEIKRIEGERRLLDWE
jgi:PAS domain S-box-containing protein|uniref:DUF438 domain-containing protein n=1 Tax=candidate division WOR-3 bacterium TaxID=2052148 RepID=A0A7C3Z2U5_UNCW3